MYTSKLYLLTIKHAKKLFSNCILQNYGFVR